MQWCRCFTMALNTTHPIGVTINLINEDLFTADDMIMTQTHIDLSGGHEFRTLSPFSWHFQLETQPSVIDHFTAEGWASWICYSWSMKRLLDYLSVECSTLTQPMEGIFGSLEQVDWPMADWRSVQENQPFWFDGDFKHPWAMIIIKKQALVLSTSVKRLQCFSVCEAEV